MYIIISNYKTYPTISQFLFTNRPKYDKVLKNLLKEVVKLMRIISDTSTLYSPEEGAALGVHIIPASIIYRDKAYRDYIDITTEKFLQLVRTGACPTSSQPAIGDLLEVFEEDDEETLALFIGDGLSGGYANAMGARNTLDDPSSIHILDTRTLAGAERYLLEKAVQLRNEGFSLEAIRTDLQYSIDASASYVIPADFEFLKRSGRLTPIAAKISSIIKIVPVMTQTPDMKKITLLTIKRSSRKATDAIIENMKKIGVDATYKLYICHGGDLAAAEAARDQLLAAFPGCEYELLPLSPAMITHGGPGCVVFQAIRK